MKSIKSLFFLVMLSINLLSCAQDSDKNLIETEFYECVKRSYSEKNIDIEEVFLNLEKIAIGTENLKDNSAESYFLMFSELAQSNQFPLKNSKVFFKKINELDNFPIDMKCFDDSIISDSLEYVNSKTYKFIRKLDEEIAKTIQSNSKPNIGKVIIDVYQKDDFDNEYIKYSLLSLVAFKNSTMNSLERELPGR